MPAINRCAHPQSSRFNLAAWCGAIASSTPSALPRHTAERWPVRPDYRCTIAAFGRPRKSECGWEVARVCWTRSQTSQKACTGRPITGYAVPMILRKSVPTWASCNLSIACSDGCAVDLDKRGPYDPQRQARAGCLADSVALSTQRALPARAFEEVGRVTFTFLGDELSRNSHRREADSRCFGSTADLDTMEHARHGGGMPRSALQCWNFPIRHSRAMARAERPCFDSSR